MGHLQTYSISSADPSTTWVHLRIPKQFTITGAGCQGESARRGPFPSRQRQAQRPARSKPVKNKQTHKINSVKKGGETLLFSDTLLTHFYAIFGRFWPYLRDPQKQQKTLKTQGFQGFLAWQGQKDLNPRHAVLETAALPTELYPYTGAND